MYHPKTIYLYDLFSKKYARQSVTKEDPQHPGRDLFPANSTEIKPPDIPEGKQAIFSNGEWLLEDIPEPEEPKNSTSPIDTSIDDFFFAIRKTITRPVLNVIGDDTLRMTVFNAFDRQNFRKIIEGWNDAIEEFPTEIAEVLNQEIKITNSNQEIEIKSRAEIAREQARLHKILLGLDEDFILFPLKPQKRLTYTELQKRLKELRLRGLTNITLNQSQEELETEYLKVTQSILQ